MTNSLGGPVPIRIVRGPAPEGDPTAASLVKIEDRPNLGDAGIPIRQRLPQGLGEEAVPAIELPVEGTEGSLDRKSVV